MTYYYARDDLRDTTKLAPYADQLGVSRDTRNQNLLSGSRLEATAGYIDLNALNVYDKATHYNLGKTLPPTKASSVSQEKNPYGWYSNDLSATRRTPVSELRDEGAAGGTRQHVPDDFDETGRRTQVDDRQPYLQDIVDIGKTLGTHREDYFDGMWSDRDVPNTARESPTLRESLQELRASKHQRELTATQADANLGRTQLGKTMLRETVAPDDDNPSPYGWQALGPTRRPTKNDISDRIVPQDEIYSSRIKTNNDPAPNPAPKNQFQENNFGDTLMPPKRLLTGTNIGQGKVYDYPYMKQVVRASDDSFNAGSLTWITMATDDKFMRWMHVMFSKFRSKWIKDKTPPSQIRKLFQRHSSKYKKRKTQAPLYTCPEKLCIAAVVTTIISFAVVVPTVMLRGYTQDPPKLQTYTMEGNLVNLTYNSVYSNTSSEEFKNISQSFCNQLATNVIKTPTKDIGYEECIVVEIRNGTTTVKMIFDVNLRPPVYVTEEEILTSLGLASDNRTLVFDNIRLSNVVTKSTN